MRHTRGDTRPDGMRFFRYSRGREVWLTEERFVIKQAEDARRSLQTYYKDVEGHRARTRTWRQLNRQREAARSSAWHRANPDKVRLMRSVAKARKKRAEVPLTEEQRGIVKAIYSSARRVSQCSGITHHVDHIIPMARGGKHFPGNLQVLPEKLNLKKNAKLDFKIS